MPTTAKRFHHKDWLNPLFDKPRWEETSESGVEGNFPEFWASKYAKNGCWIGGWERFFLLFEDEKLMMGTVPVPASSMRHTQPHASCYGCCWLPLVSLMVCLPLTWITTMWSKMMSHATILKWPVPLTNAEWSLMNWHTLTASIMDDDTHCYYTGYLHPIQ